ncbi:MAG: DUF1697 domain-containing protein [Nocardioidaceae bacterium]
MTSEPGHGPVVILLRAVNLGSRNKVPMARLREVLGELGATDVSTYIQSGNIICTPPADSQELDRAVESAIAAEFGVTTTAVSRTAAELGAALDAYPFEVVEPRFAAISFLEHEPDPSLAEALTARDFGDDLCAVVGRELHLRYLNGVHTSRLTNAVLARALGGIEGTARNLRTVQKLVELSG